MVKRFFFVGLILGVCGITSQGIAEEAVKNEKEKSELAKIMSEIDKNYKAVEEISVYYKYSSNDWKLIAESSINLTKLTKVVISKFPRPDDKKYQDLNTTMLVEAEKMYEVVSHKDEQGALEDAQWQVRRLRQTCALCHKHLGIHLYPQLYPVKKDELPPGLEEIPAPKTSDAPKDW